MSKKTWGLWLALFIFNTAIFGQQNSGFVMTLNQIIEVAQKNSPSYQKAITSAETSFWNYKNYRSTLFPKLGLRATLPNYSAGNDRVQQPDGSFTLRKRSLLYNSVDLNLDQNIPFTGGVLSLSSSLARNQVYTPVPELEFFSIPFSFNYSQPMLLYNNIRWANKIQPLLYSESMKKYTEDIEQISIETSTYFFSAITSQINFEISSLNYNNTDTLYQISKGRYNLGKIAENDLLQIELNLLNAENNLYQANIQRENNYKNLMRFLGFPLDTVIQLALPDIIPDLALNEEKALQEAYDNKSQVLEFEKRKIQADQRIAQARGNSGYNLSIQGQFGGSSVGNTIPETYANELSQQQYLALSLTIPLVDWGASKSRIKMARSSKDLDIVNIEQDEINFEQEIRIEVKNYYSQRKQVVISAKADTIGQKRYLVTKERYMMGKISITDLNLAQTEMSQAKRNYLNALRSSWNSYFRIRTLTLYNFESNEKIFFEYSVD